MYYVYTYICIMCIYVYVHIYTYTLYVHINMCMCHRRAKDGLFTPRQVRQDKVWMCRLLLICVFNSFYTYIKYFVKHFMYILYT